MQVLPRFRYLLPEASRSLKCLPFGPPATSASPVCIPHRHYRKHPNFTKHQHSKVVSKYIHGYDNNLNFQLEGVSDKMHPIMLTWERPARVRRFSQSEHGSGDLEGFPDLDLTRHPYELEACEAIESSDDQVKKILSLEYANNRELVNTAKEDIARLILLQYDKINAESPKFRHMIKIKVDARRVLLRRLREEDYKKFEWLLEKLNLVYKPRPHIYERVERKKMITRLTDLWCTEFKESKMMEYRYSLEDQQPMYLRDKAEKLRFIMKEEKELGIQPSVTPSEIEDCLRRADEIEAKNAKRRQKSADDTDHRHFLVYRKEKAKPELVYRKQ